MARLAAALLGAYIVAATTLVVLVEWNDRELRAELDELRYHGLPTTGTITSFASHNDVCYTYVVDTRNYRGCHGDWLVYSSGQRVGGSIPVVYDAINPALSCNCDPAKEYYNRTVGPYAFGLVGGVVGIILFLVARQWWRRTGPD